MTNLHAVLLTAQSPISHGDPKGSSGNIMTFNRQKIVVKEPLSKPQQENTLVWLNEFAKHIIVPNRIKELVQKLEPHSFVVAAIVEHFLEEYATREGDGIFSGTNRYERLASRLQAVGKSATNLRMFMEKLCSEMKVEVPNSPLWLIGMKCPDEFGEWVCRTATSEARTIVAIAREWVRLRKLLDPSYAESIGEEVNESDYSYLTFDTIGVPSNIEVLTVEMPMISANSIRHVLFRNPLYEHLIEVLQINRNQPPTADVLATFYNGGDLASGATQRDASLWDQKEVLKRYPSLGLLSGCTTQFMLGQSSLTANAFIVCKENNSITRKFGIESQESVFSLLEDVTETRMAGQVGRGQMIHNAEMLMKGTQILVVFGFKVFATDLEKSAAVKAIEVWQESPYIGGRGARGFGLCSLEWLTDKPQKASIYHDYMVANKDALRNGMYDAQLTTQHRLYV